MLENYLKTFNIQKVFLKMNTFYICQFFFYNVFIFWRGSCVIIILETTRKIDLYDITIVHLKKNAGITTSYEFPVALSGQFAACLPQ